MITVAYAQQAGTPPGSGISTLIMMVAMFAIIYFLMIRPQQKKQKELKNLIDNLQRGDEVLTAGGLLGRISGLDEHYIELDITDKVTIKMQRNSVVNVLPKGSVKGINQAANKQ